MFTRYSVDLSSAAELSGISDAVFCSRPKGDEVGLIDHDELDHEGGGGPPSEHAYHSSKTGPVAVICAPFTQFSDRVSSSITLPACCRDGVRYIIVAFCYATKSDYAKFKDDVVSKQSGLTFLCSSNH